MKKYRLVTYAFEINDKITLANHNCIFSINNYYNIELKTAFVVM